MLKKSLLVLVFALTALSIQGCGEKQFTKGSYDDVEQENLLNDKWSETDMQKAVSELAQSLLSSRVLAEAKKPPVVMVTRLENKTSEIIETKSITSMMMVELTQSGKAQFVDKDARQDLAEEYEYQNSGMVSKESKKGPGGQIGADYILNGRIDSIVQEVGKDKTVYYKLSFSLSNMKTSLIEWAGQKQIRKKFKKKRVSG